MTENGWAIQTPSRGWVGEVWVCGYVVGVFVGGGGGGGGGSSANVVLPVVLLLQSTC